MVMIANLQYAWTLFVPPMQTGTGWKLSDIQFAFTLFILFQTWVQPLDGWLIDRVGPRGFITAAGVLCGLGWAGLGYASSLPMLYVLYCLAGTGAAFVYSGSIGSALKWFKDRRGLASGIIAAGYGGGTALFIPFISSMIKDSGYQQAFFATGLFQGVVIAVVAQFLRHPPAEAATTAAAGAKVASTSKPQLTTIEMLRTPRFYYMYVMFIAMAVGGLLVTANQSAMAKAWGLPAAALTLAATLSPIANGTARVFWGWASDRIGRETAMMVSFVLQAVCLFLVVLLGRTSSFWFSATLVLVYFTWGQIYSLFPSATGDYFGARHATSNYAVMYTAKGVGAIIGPWLGALLYERSGSWNMDLYGSAVLALIAAGMALALRVNRAAPVPEAAAPLSRAIPAK
jgi:OFA family oxalate/formate antiporter-like MFS transporter